MNCQEYFTYASDTPRAVSKTLDFRCGPLLELSMQFHFDNSSIPTDLLTILQTPVMACESGSSKLSRARQEVRASYTTSEAFRLKDARICIFMWLAVLHSHLPGAEQSYFFQSLKAIMHAIEPNVPTALDVLLADTSLIMPIHELLT